MAGEQRLVANASDQQLLKNSEGCINPAGDLCALQCSLLDLFRADAYTAPTNLRLSSVKRRCLPKEQASWPPTKEKKPDAVREDAYLWPAHHLLPGSRAGIWAGDDSYWYLLWEPYPISGCLQCLSKICSTIVVWKRADGKEPPKLGLSI